MAPLPRWFWVSARMTIGSVAIGAIIIACTGHRPSHSGATATDSAPASGNSATSPTVGRPDGQTPVPAGTTVGSSPGALPAADAPSNQRTVEPAAPSTVPHGAGPQAVASVAANSDGCNHNYGETGQCVPVSAPGGGVVNCATLTSLGLFNPPLVVKIDSLGLMAKPDVAMGWTADHKYMTVRSCRD